VKMNDSESYVRTVGICHLCVHFGDRLANGRWSCKAFPAGIPFAIRTGEIDHRQPFDGDNGIVFEPLPGSDSTLR
jgi:hypothetical protein